MEDFSNRMSLLERNVLARSAAPERETSPAHSASSSGEEEPIEQEKREGPLLVPSGAIPSGDQPMDPVVTECS
jgi:hypothetical protein